MSDDTKPAEPVYKLLLTKITNEMSVKFFHLSDRPNTIQYEVKAGDIDFIGARDFAADETIGDSLLATYNQAKEELRRIVEAQRDHMLREGGRLM